MSSVVRSSRVAIARGIALIALVVAAIAWRPLGTVFEHEVGVWQNALAARLSGRSTLSGWRLKTVAFFGGLVASISPCILGMLPLNLSYIGASNLRSRTAALRVAVMFVFGVVVVNVVLGLISSLFFALFVEYRAPVNMAVGVLTVVMGVPASGFCTGRRLSMPVRLFGW
jgi:cytochrome c-type biogenesis protein